MTVVSNIFWRIHGPLNSRHHRQRLDRLEMTSMLPEPGSLAELRYAYIPLVQSPRWGGI